MWAVLNDVKGSAKTPNDFPIRWRHLAFSLMLGGLRRSKNGRTSREQLKFYGRRFDV